MMTTLVPGKLYKTHRLGGAPGSRNIWDDSVKPWRFFCYSPDVLTDDGTVFGAQLREYEKQVEPLFITQNDILLFLGSWLMIWDGIDKSSTYVWFFLFKDKIVAPNAYLSGNECFFEKIGQ